MNTQTTPNTFNFDYEGLKRLAKEATSETGTGFAGQHFAAVCTPERVLAIMEQLELSERSRVTLANDHAATHDELTSIISRVNREKRQLQQLVDEVKPPMLDVYMPEAFYPDGDIEAPLVVDQAAMVDALTAAGGRAVFTCERCDTLIDLTHRPDGVHYCHASEETDA